MKKTLFLVCLISILTACSNPAPPTVIKRADNLSILQSDNFEYTTIEIEGCEYLAWRSAYGYINVTHKGNCKNHKTK